jgi:hypothetical protein
VIRNVVVGRLRPGVGYDTDEEHNRIRRELFAPLCAQIVRVQIHVDPGR